MDYKKLPYHIQKAFEKKIRLFMEDIHHPSLRVRNLRVTKIGGKQVSPCFIVLPLKSAKDIISLEGLVLTTY